jgi:hypothetical protein
MNYLISLLRSKPAVLALGFALGAAGLGLAHTTEKSRSSNPPATLKLADPGEAPSKTRQRSSAIRRQHLFLESRA